jgi:hypothetical protein
VSEVLESLPDIDAPERGLFVIPTQNREDPAKQRFQLQLHNLTERRLRVDGVRLIWEGLSTPVTAAGHGVVPGQVIDLPVPMESAACVGSGGIDDMPSIDEAMVELTLDSGLLERVQLYDEQRVLRKLYLKDCERQLIGRHVSLQWVDVSRAEFDGRPITEVTLLLRRGSSTREVRVVSVSPTIPHVPLALNPTDPLLLLAPATREASARFRFLEGRCDAHAIAETKQPFKFVVQIDLGDGTLRPVIVTPTVDDQKVIRQTAFDGCAVLGENVPLG